MSAPMQKQIRALQKTLYERAYSEAHTLHLHQTDDLLKYEKKFKNSLPQTFTKTNFAALLNRFSQSRIVLFGDFHTLRQAQRELIRILRQAVQVPDQKPIYLHMEAFRQCDNDLIRQYLAGDIAEKDFLSETRYYQNWGFYWENYRMILDFARNHDIPVYGINTDTSGDDSLGVRDRFAAKKLRWALESFPESIHVCIIGELHLADQHLPRALHAELKRGKIEEQALRILTNVDEYYFQLSQRDSPGSTEVLELRKNLYCIINCPPWLKWQSFALFEELRLLQEEPESLDMELDQDLYTESSLDIDYKFFDMVKYLADFIKIKIETIELSNFHIYQVAENKVVDHLFENKTINSEELLAVLDRAALAGVYFYSPQNSIFLSSLSVNHISEAAGQFLHSVNTRFSELASSESERFYKQVIKSIVGMISSKIFNPRRKCMDIPHYEAYAEHNHKKRLVGGRRQKRDIARAILKHHRWMTQRIYNADKTFHHPIKSVYHVDNLVCGDVSRRVGQFLGNHLYRRVMTNQIPESIITKLFDQEFADFNVVWHWFRNLYELALFEDFPIDLLDSL